MVVRFHGGPKLSKYDSGGMPLGRDLVSTSSGVALRCGTLRVDATLQRARQTLWANIPLRAYVQAAGNLRYLWPVREDQSVGAACIRQYLHTDLLAAGR